MKTKVIGILILLVLCCYAVATIPVRLGLDLRGGSSLIVKIQMPGNETPEQRAAIFDQCRQVIERKINAFGLSEAAIQPYGSDNTQLLVQLPAVSDPSHIKQLLKTQAVLEWTAVKAGPFATREEIPLELGTKPMFAPRQKAWYQLDRNPVVRGSDIRDARSTEGNGGGWITAFTLSQEAGARFEQYTSKNIGKPSAIVLDDQIISVATIEDRIRDTGSIRGAGNQQEATDLAFNLRAGSMPAAISFLSERTVEPSLGADSIRQGLRAGAVGLAAVVVAMLAYYGRKGVNATVVLLLNALILMAALVSFDAVLTLPGIAGVILTIGMAVDSNVLIFERIREEARAGKAYFQSISGGFQKAFATIIDTHITTVVSCAILYMFGTTAVKGFALTLAIGLVINVFTAVFVSKTLFDLMPVPEAVRAG